MVRSKKQRLKIANHQKYSLSFLIFSSLNLLISILCLFTQNILAEEKEEKDSTEDTSVLIKENKSKNANSIETYYSELFREKAKEAHAGVILGNIIAVDDDSHYIYVKPKETGLGRLFVYIDSKTAITFEEKNKRKKLKISDLFEGDRVAIRSLAKYGIILADEIFLIKGDFEQKTKYAKKKISAASKPAGEKEKKSGGH